MTGSERRHVVVTLSLPDRPGALGAVASRIGAIGADITDVTIRRHGLGVAEDVFHIDLPAHGDLDLVGLLLAEIEQVDGVGTATVCHSLADGCCQEPPAEVADAS